MRPRSACVLRPSSSGGRPASVRVPPAPRCCALAGHSETAVDCCQSPTSRPAKRTDCARQSLVKQRTQSMLCYRPCAPQAPFPTHASRKNLTTPWCRQLIALPLPARCAGCQVFKLPPDMLAKHRVALATPLAGAAAAPPPAAPGEPRGRPSGAAGSAPACLQRTPAAKGGWITARDLAPPGGSEGAVLRFCYWLHASP